MSIQLLLVRIGIQVKVQANFLEANRGIFGDAEGAAKNEIALGGDGGIAQIDFDRGGYRLSFSCA